MNTTLWGIPAHIIQGNTLTMEIQNDWKNLHWHRVGEDQRQAMRRVFDLFRSPIDDERSDENPSESNRSEPEEKRQQFEFSFE